MRLSLLLAALVLLPACDTGSYDDGYDDGYDAGLDNAPTNGATFVDFTLDATEYRVNDGPGQDQRTASYETDRIDESAVRGAVERALATAGDGALVALYIKSYLVTNQATPADTSTYSALPLSRGFDRLVLVDTDNDGDPDGSVFVVEYTASYEFSFDNQDLYFDVVSSKPASDFGTNPEFLFDAITPQETNAAGVRLGPDDLEFRLVTVPATAGQRPVDMTDYAAVKAAYNLPD